MKVNELLEFVEKNRTKMLKAEQLQELLKKTLEVKKYIGIKNKKQLIDDIVNACVIYENGVFKFNDIDKYISFTMKTIETYTNLELSSDIEEDYDILCRLGILELIIGTFKKEYDDVSVLLQMQCDYIISGNSIEAQVGKFLTSMSEKIDGIAEVISDKISNFDPSKLPVGEKDLGKLMEFINMQKKF
jgi:hypothetical protein